MRAKNLCDLQDKINNSKFVYMHPIGNVSLIGDEVVQLVEVIE